VEVSKKLVFVNAISSAATRVINVFVLLWIYDYLLERIPPKEFAVYPVVAAVIVFAPLFFSMFTGGISRYVIEAYARSDDRRAKEVFSSILPPLAGGSLIFLALGLTFSWFIDAVLTVPPNQIWDARVMMALLVISFAYQMMLLPFSVGFDVKQRYVHLNLIHIARDLARNAMLLVLLLGVSPRVIWVVVTTVSANIVAVTVIAWLSQRMLAHLRFDRSLSNWVTAKQLLGFGVWTTLGQLSNMIYTGAGVIVLNKLGTAVDVAGYHVAATMDRQLRAVTAVAAHPVQPALTAMHATNDERRLANTFLRAGRYALWTTLIVATPLAVYSVEFIQLYIGDRYSQTAIVVILLMAMYPFTYSNFLLPRIAMATAQVRQFNVANFVTHIIHLMIMMLMAGWLNLGAVGVASATFFTVVVAQVAYFWPMALRMTKVPFRRFAKEVLLPGLLPAGFGLAIWLALKVYDPPSGWIQLILYTLVGQAVYAALLLQFCLQGFERQELVRVFAKIAALTKRKRK